MVHEDKKYLYYALYCTTAMKLYKLDKDSPDSLPELILNKLDSCAFSKTSNKQKSKKSKNLKNEEKVFWISRYSGSLNPTVSEKQYADFQLSDIELKSLPKNMRACVTTETESGESTHSIRIRVSQETNDYQKSHPSRKRMETDDYKSWVIIKQLKWMKKEKTLFKIQPREWLEHQLTHNEYFLEEKLTNYQVKYNHILHDGVKPDYPFCRLSSCQELLNLSSGSIPHDTVHIAANLNRGTRIFLASINLNLKKVIRSQVINIMPEMENEGPNFLSRYQVLGLIWDIELNRAIASIYNERSGRTTFVKIKNLTDIKKRSFETFHEVAVRALYCNHKFLCKRYINYVQSYQEEVFKAFEESLTINPETGMIRSNVLFSDSFEFFVEGVLLKNFKDLTCDDITHSIGVGEAWSGGLTLLASDKSVYLYDRKNNFLVWERGFKHNIIDGMVSEGRIASIDGRRHILSVFGVNKKDEKNEFFGKIGKVDLAKIDLFDSFGFLGTALNYLRLKEFIFLPQEGLYLAVIEQVPLNDQPLTPMTPVEEEVVVFKNLASRSDQAPPEKKYQHLALIKLTPEAEIVEKSVVRYSTTERLYTAVSNSTLVVLRAIKNHQTTQFGANNSLFILDFIDLKTLKKRENEQNSRTFTFKTYNCVSSFMYKEPGYLQLVMSKYRMTCERDFIEADCMEYRNDRLSLMKYENYRDALVDNKVATYTLVFKDAEAQEEEKEEESVFNENFGPSANIEDADGTWLPLDIELEQTAQKERIDKLFEERRRNQDLEGDSKTFKTFEELFEGVKLKTLQTFKEPYGGNRVRRKIHHTYFFGEGKGLLNSPSAFFTLYFDTNQKEGGPLYLKFWNENSRRIAQKTYKDYFGELPEDDQSESESPKKKKKEYITVSDLLPLDGYRVAVLEYVTKWKYKTEDKKVGYDGDRAGSNA